jgi:DNA-binding beta-propeller fold protein YncE
MRRPVLRLLFFFFPILSFAQKPGKWTNQILLPNGWLLSPAGKSIGLGDLPLNMAVSASKKYLAVTNNGYSDQSIQIIDLAKGKVVDSMPIAKSWYGLKFAGNDETIYASAGNDNRINQYAFANGKLRLVDSFLLGPKLPRLISPAGIDVDDAKNRLYTVTKESDSLYVFDTKTEVLVRAVPLGGEGYTCLLSPDKKLLYVSCWGCDQVKIFDTQTLAFTGSIKVGDNPNELLLSRSGFWLFVANANDNSVSVIDTRKKTVVEVLNAALFPNSPPGSTSNGLALSEDEKTLFIANADNNCLAVFDVAKPGQSQSKGFIPTGWYPTNVKVIGKNIYVTNGKGLSSAPNPFGPNPLVPDQAVVYQHGDSSQPMKVQYIGGLYRGSLGIIPIPAAKTLAGYSRQVYQNTPYGKKKEPENWGEKGNPIPSKKGEKSPIKYVFYVIKENRTYDQVLGDMKEGAGDTSLVLFGETITPNQHALARQFVLLDNFYVNAEVSADGHNWSVGAYATDYLEKTWPTYYGDRGGHYDGEGNREIANNKGGFLWDYCKRTGVSYRTYGEFVDNYKPTLPVLKGHYCPYFTGWNMSVKDTSRFYQWKKEFDSLLAINKVPQLTTLRFPNDHTEGTMKGKPTPFAHMADNDLAVGLFVEYLSRSPIWKETAIFIVEDDAQNGADHVDAHRTTAYVAGGFVKRGVVDHTMYSTTSMIRTIELILGLPPMSQYDAAATPMWRCFTTKPDLTPFKALPTNVDLNTKNVVVNEWQRRSELFNLAKEDAVPDLEFNRVLWHGIKGDHVPFPAPKRAAFLKIKEKTDDED